MIINDEEQQFEVFKQLVFKHFGLDCQFYKPNYIKRRMAVRMRALAITTYRDYNEYLRANVTEFELLLDKMTINVSHFFRDPDTFRAIKKLVIPELEKKSQIKVWSAGCANGEEPYSLAMALHDRIPLSQVQILATDIDTLCLGRARTGVYKEASLANVSQSLRARYFDRREDNVWSVKPQIKDCISFQRHDLTGTLLAGPFHLIVCRNVMIYFNRQLQERLLKTFASLLTQDGFLVVGKTEVLLAESRHLYRTIDLNERVYQLRSEPEGVAPAG